MLGFLKKKPKEKAPPQLFDLNGEPLANGDKVKSLRYELGECHIELRGLEYFYISTRDKKEVSYVKMVDAITGHQKVLKL